MMRRTAVRVLLCRGCTNGVALKSWIGGLHVVEHDMYGSEKEPGVSEVTVSPWPLP